MAKYPDKHFNEQYMIKELAKHEENIKTALRRHGKIVKDKLTRTIKTSRGSGHHYPNLPNRSSSPGQKPVSQSRKLEKSFHFRARTNELLIYNDARSDKGAPYPAFLNEGTRKMAPRQYFDNTIESAAIFLERDLANIERPNKRFIDKVIDMFKK